MKFAIQDNGSRPDVIQNYNLLGFRVTIDATAETSVIAPTQHNLQADLSRRGETTSLCSGNIFALSLASGFQSEEGVTIAGHYGYTVTFPSVVNIDGDDKVTVNYKVAGQTDTTTTVESIYGVGLEWFTPQLTVYYRPVAGNTFGYQFGDNVLSVTVINAGTAHAINGISFSSNVYKAEGLDTASFFALMAEQWQRTITRYCYDIYRYDVPANGCTANVSFDSAVTADVFIVVAGGRTSPIARVKSQKRAEKIMQYNAAKYGY